MELLTKSQKKVYDYLVEFILTSQRAPTMQEVSEHFGVRHTSIQACYKELIYKGWLKKKKHKTGGIMPVDLKIVKK